jgi:hypothetical protein
MAFGVESIFPAPDIARIVSVRLGPALQWIGQRPRLTANDEPLFSMIWMNANLANWANKVYYR